MEVSSIKLDAKIQIEDPESLLVSNTSTKIVENSKNKIVYEQEEQMGQYEFSIVVENLNPGTEYTLVCTATYEANGMKYTRDFISKIFITEQLGFNLVKDYYTRDTLAFIIKSDAFSKIKSADLVLLNSNGSVLKTYAVDGNMAKTAGGFPVEFSGLTANTSYKAKLINFLYEGAVISEGFGIELNCKTLKNRPEIGKPDYLIDRRTSTVTLKLDNIKDVDNGITKYKFEVYDTRNTETTTPISSIDKVTSRTVDLQLDEKFYQKGVPYVFRVVTEFYDNEKTIEYVSEYSDIFKIEGVEFPTVRFEPQTITFERIEGNIIISDPANTISFDNDNKIEIRYQDTLGTGSSYTNTGSLTIPFNFSGLKRDEKYTIHVYANVNLQDGKAATKSLIGGLSVKTNDTKALAVDFESDAENVENAFTVKAKLSSKQNEDATLEANTLTEITVNLYSGKTATGTPVAYQQLNDTDISPYVSTLKTLMYDNQLVITPAFFGLRNVDMIEENYTIEIKGAYDYTGYTLNGNKIYGNKIKLERTNGATNSDNTAAVSDYITTNGFVPDLPANINDALTVEPVYDGDTDYGTKRTDLDDQTIVGYKVKAIYDNSRNYLRKLTYKVYDATTNTLIPSATRVENVNPITNTWAQQIFYLADGTPTSTTDTVMARGNSYYFTYEADLNLNPTVDNIAETHYPVQVLGQNPIVLRSLKKDAAKQKAIFTMYPTNSTSTTMIWNYKYSDIDQTLTANTFYTKIGSSAKPNVAITATPGSSTYTSATFTSLSAGKLNVYVNHALYKYAPENRMPVLIDYNFEGVYSFGTVGFHVDVGASNLKISINDPDTIPDKIKRIAALKVTLSNGTTTVVKDNIPIPTSQTNFIYLDLADNQIKDLINTNFNVQVEAYYDSGVAGFATGKTDFAIQSTTDGTYKILNAVNSIFSMPNASAAKYTATLNTSTLNLTNVVNNVSQNLNISYSENGIIYNNELIILKALEKVSLQDDGSGTGTTFNVIVPGVSLNTVGGTYDVVPTLISASVGIRLFGTNASAMENDLLYIELYETNSNGTTSNLLNTISVNKTNLGNKIELNNLTPKSYYYIRVFSNLYRDGVYEKSYLYDVDFGSTSKLYYFSTLSQVAITFNNPTAGKPNPEYNPTNYKTKTLDFYYQLGQTIGVSKVKYTLFKKDINNNKIPMATTITTTIPSTKDNLVRIQCNPGSEFEFGKNYAIDLEPITEINNGGNIQEIDIGKTTYNFTLRALMSPNVSITAKAIDTSTIDFKPSILDTDKIIVSSRDVNGDPTPVGQIGVYTIKVMDKMNNDVTPIAMKNVEYDINTPNPTFRIGSLAKGADYTFYIYAKLDKNNNMNKNSFEDFVFQTTGSTMDDSGIDLGTVNTAVNAVDRKKIDLVFFDSTNLTSITEIRYSIYGPNGYSASNAIPFAGSVIYVSSGNYYYRTLPETLGSAGQYSLQIQFLVGTTVVKTKTLTHALT
jgi:hypothetical protein